MASRVEAADQMDGLDLTPEPRTEFRVAGLLQADELDRDLAPARRFPQVDDSHSADREPFKQTVAADLARIAVL